MEKQYRLLVKERIASIRDIQKNPSKMLKGITRVMRGGKTFGFFFSNEEMDELLEDLEAATSKDLRARVRRVRKDFKQKNNISLAALSKEYGV